METLLNIDFATLESMLKSFLWPFFRISGMMMSMVIIGSIIISRIKRVLLALLVTIVVAPMLPPMPDVELLGVASFVISVQQVLIGIAVGFISRMVFETVIVGGQVVAMSSGLGFAQINDPSSGVTVPAVGQFFLMMATLVFLSIDGHLLMFEIIVASFTSLPVSTSGLLASSIAEIISFASLMFSAGLMMALAAIISLLLVNLSFGILTKVAPTLNIFSIGFPIILTFGLLILWFTIGGFLTHFNQQFVRGQQTMCSIVNMECGHGS